MIEYCISYQIILRFDISHVKKTHYQYQTHKQEHINCILAF